MVESRLPNSGNAPGRKQFLHGSEQAVADSLLFASSKPSPFRFPPLPPGIALIRTAPGGTAARQTKTKTVCTSADLIRGDRCSLGRSPISLESPHGGAVVSPGIVAQALSSTRPDRHLEALSPAGSQCVGCRKVHCAWAGRSQPGDGAPGGRDRLDRCLGPQGLPCSANALRVRVTEPMSVGHPRAVGDPSKFRHFWRH